LHQELVLEPCRERGDGDEPRVRVGNRARGGHRVLRQPLGQDRRELDEQHRTLEANTRPCGPLSSLRPFQRRTARERIGVDAHELSGGHPNALGEPQAVTDALLERG
jgi:hypothetical protein